MFTNILVNILYIINFCRG